MTAMIVFTQPLKSAAVGAYLESLREQAGFSPNHMAAYLGYTRKQVQNWEAGTSPVKRAILISYAIASGQDPDGVVQRAAELADREESGVSVGSHHSNLIPFPGITPARPTFEPIAS